MPPPYIPESTFPFATNALVVLSQIWIMTTGDLFTYNTRIVVGFAGCAIITESLAFVACLPLGWNYWLCFILLIPFGFFSGIA